MKCERRSAALLLGDFVASLAMLDLVSGMDGEKAQ
jgi:hypothetical protein